MVEPVRLLTLGARFPAELPKGWSTYRPTIGEKQAIIFDILTRPLPRCEFTSQLCMGLCPAAHPMWQVQNHTPSAPSVTSVSVAAPSVRMVSHASIGSS